MKHLPILIVFYINLPTSFPSITLQPLQFDQLTTTTLSPAVADKNSKEEESKEKQKKNKIKILITLTTHLKYHYHHLILLKILHFKVKNWNMKKSAIKVNKVAIIDLDIHHGNGTEDIVRQLNQPDKLFFYSIHLYDKPA